MEKLIQQYKNLQNDLGDIYVRACFKNLSTGGRITGIVGERGVGKTTYLLHYLRENYHNNERALYVSADHIYFSENTLVDLADKFTKQHDGEILCIDEIHRYQNWAQELKNIYDFHPKFKIVFSGSSSINLTQEKYDLSRRTILKKLYGFSFREYLEFTLKKKFPLLNLTELTSGNLGNCEEISKIPKLLGRFNDYLKLGYYPFSHELKNERDFYDALSGVIEKVIYQDISSYYSLKTKTLNVFKKILYFIATSTPGSININNLSNSLKKDHTDTGNYLDMLKNSGLLRYLLIDKTGHALIRNAEKVYINNTNLHHAINYDIGKPIEKGALRELFFLSQLESSGYDVFYSKVGDFSCESYIFEIGGKNKSSAQIRNQKKAYIVKDDILYPFGNTIPLYLFGFLY